jgi:hypothetical protein
VLIGQKIPLIICGVVHKLLRSDSDFDIRNNFQLGAVYETGNARGNTFARALLSNWGIDARVSALPADGARNYDPITSTYINLQPNYDAALPLHVYDSSPGGKRINFAAFKNAAAGVQGNTNRNFARGFGLLQMDAAASYSLCTNLPGQVINNSGALSYRSSGVLEGPEYVQRPCRKR